MNRWTRPMLTRGKQLREAELSYQSIAIVINLDYGTELTGKGVRSALNKYFDMPKDYRRYDPNRQLKVTQ